MLQGTKLTAALRKIRLIAVHGPWTRIVSFRHMLQAPFGLSGGPKPLWGGAAKIGGARFTPKGSFDSLYLAWEPVTALMEVQALVQLPGAAIPLRSAPWALVTVDGIVSNVLDLTDAETLEALKTNEQEMTGAWVKNAAPPTQTLGKAAYDSARLRGIKYLSARHPGGMNLVVFPERLLPTSLDYLQVFDPHGNLEQRIGARA